MKGFQSFFLFPCLFVAGFGFVYFSVVQADFCRFCFFADIQEDFANELFCWRVLHYVHATRFAVITGC